MDSSSPCSLADVELDENSAMLQLTNGDAVIVDADKYERLRRYGWRWAFVGPPYSDFEVIAVRDDGRVCLLAEVVMGLADLESGERRDGLVLYLIQPAVA